MELKVLECPILQVTQLLEGRACQWISKGSTSRTYLFVWLDDKKIEGKFPYKESCIPGVETGLFKKIMFHWGAVLTTPRDAQGLHLALFSKITLCGAWRVT